MITVQIFVFLYCLKVDNGVVTNGIVILKKLSEVRPQNVIVLLPVLLSDVLAVHC